MFKLQKQENIFLKTARQAVTEKRDVYIYGCGQIGKIVCRMLYQRQVPIKSFFVDREFLGGYTEKWHKNSARQHCPRCSC